MLVDRVNVVHNVPTVLWPLHNFFQILTAHFCWLCTALYPCCRPFERGKRVWYCGIECVWKENYQSSIIVSLSADQKWHWPKGIDGAPLKYWRPLHLNWTWKLSKDSFVWRPIIINSPRSSKERDQDDSLCFINLKEPKERWAILEFCSIFKLYWTFNIYTNDVVVNMTLITFSETDLDRICWPKGSFPFRRLHWPNGEQMLLFRP